MRAIMQKGTAPLLYAGIFFLSLSALMLEISLTRVFSIAKWYHFAFMVVSIALLGFAAAGSVIASRPWLLKKGLTRLLCFGSGFASLSILLSYALTNTIPFDPFLFLLDPMQVLSIALHYVLLATPFFFIGFCFASAFSLKTEKAGKLYSADLIGAAGGTIAAVALASAMPTQQVIVAAALLAGISFLLFSVNFSRKAVLLSVAWIGVLCFLLLFQQPFLQINASPYKELNRLLAFPGSSILQTNWGSSAKVDLVQSDLIRSAPGLSLQFQGNVPTQLGLIVDNDNLQPLIEAKDVEQLRFLDFLPNSLAFDLSERKHVLILGFNQLNLLTALRKNADTVTVVEPEQAIADIALNRLEQREREKVSLIVGEGRNFLRASTQRFDVIEISLNESVFASSTGLYALNENYRFTVEAFELYFDSLTESGVFSITKWLLVPPRESVKTAAIAIAALERKGKQAEKHIAMFRSINTFTLLVKKSPFSEKEIAQIKKFAVEKKFDLIYYNGIQEQETNRFNKFEQPIHFQAINAILSAEREKVVADYLFDVSSATDERPFFNNFFRWSKWREFFESVGEKWQPFFEGGFLVFLILLQGAFLSVLFIFLPFYYSKRKKTAMPAKARTVCYFFLIGIAFLFIEIALVQRFILFLGHPVYAISAVLFSLLVGSGIGAFLTSKLKTFNQKTLAPIIFFLAFGVLFYSTLLSTAFNLMLAAPLTQRFLFSFVLLAPLGFLMGMPFPIGIRIAGKTEKRLIALGYCANGCASVLSPALAIVIAISFGFSTVFALAALCYLAALAAIALLQ